MEKLNKEFIESFFNAKNDKDKLERLDHLGRENNNILEEIKEAIKINKIAIIIRTGALFGTGIENISIMEESAVYQMNLPLIIMYPAVVFEENKLKFLNCRLASGYRAISI